MAQKPAGSKASNQQADLPCTNSNSLQFINTQTTTTLPPKPRKSNAQQRQISRPNLQPTSYNVPARNTRRGLHPFSLAGGRLPPTHGGSYVDPSYHAYNPAYRKEQNTPLWGLAKPLPRVVRPGMRRGYGGEEQGTVEDAEEEIAAPGSSEAIPQVGMINDQRDDEGKEPFADKNKGRRERGYGHQTHQRSTTQGSIGRARSQNSVVDTYSSPLHEEGDPLDGWGAQQATNQKAGPFDDQHGDLGERWMGRLSSLQEMPSQSLFRSSTSPIDPRNEGVDVNDIDIEAGCQADEWPMDDDEVKQYMEERDTHNSWADFRAKFREPLAECLATMIAVLIGLCTNLSVQTSNDKSGSYQSTNWAWGLGVTIGIYIAGGISGAHINPAISLMLCLYRGFPFRKALTYISAQVFGAFLAGLIAYGVYKEAISAFDSIGGSIAANGGSSAAVGLFPGGSGRSFFTQPAPFAGAGTGFFNEFVATAILACAILALGDDSNAPPGAGMHAFIVGLLVTVLSMAFGYNTAACLNPARDLGPRIATAVVGYGGQVFTANNAWWIYGAWGATITGALVGGFFYDMAIFVGGESPVNYPRGKRKKAQRKAKEATRRRWWGLQKGGRKGELVL